MYRPSKYAKEFVSVLLTAKKYAALVAFAEHLRDMRNAVSEYIFNNMMEVMEMSKMEFVTFMRHNFEFAGKIPSTFDAGLYGSVYISYENRIAAIIRKIEFKCIEYKGVELYKKAVPKKGKKAGDIKRYLYEAYKTDLTETLTFLARYGNEHSDVDLVKWIVLEEHKENVDSNKIKRYEKYLRVIEKFGLENLLRIGHAKRERVLKQYEKKIEFKSLTFIGKSRKKKILEKNTKNEHSKIKAFIKLSGIPDYESMNIPVKVSHKYHGSIDKYAKKSSEYDYVLMIDEKKKRIKVVLVKDGERFYPLVSEITDENTMGIDVNLKHNLFALSDGTTYDYDRKLVKKYFDLMADIDGLKKNKQDIPKELDNQRKEYERLMKCHTQELIVRMCKESRDKGITHFVMEDLDGSFGRSHVRTDGEDFDKVKYTRLQRFLCISSLKDEVKHIASNYGIALSLVNPAYTSQRCPICGCIHEENRPTQEDFLCMECQHKMNADINSAINIKNLVVDAVLRLKLLKSNEEDQNGTFVPKSFKDRKKIKDIMVSCGKNRNTENNNQTTQVADY